jgi:fibronectin type 3 domain-containing protein
MLYGYGRVNAFRALAYAALPPADSIPPTTPPGFEAKLLDGSRVALSWKESHDDVGVSFYEIFRDSVKIGETENTSYIDSKLETNAKYSYSVRARDAVQNVSVMSEIEEVTTLSPSLSVIYSSVVSSTNDSVVISWETNIPSYCSIYYGKNALEMPSSTSDSLLSKTHRVTIIELDPKTTYYYFIEAKDDMNLSRATSSIQAFRTRVK